VAGTLAGQLTLDGAWQVRDVHGGSPAGRDWLAAVVPGCIHLDLMRAKKIPDPFFRTNEDEVQWVGARDWEYRRAFVLPKRHALWSADRVDLVFEGLDTFGDVRVNGTVVGRADNMFIPWRFDVREAVRPGRNTLAVRFTSPETVGAAEREQSPQLAKYTGKEVRAYVRKAQCHFGWDWGPRLVTSGIWRPCRLEWRTAARIADVWARTVDLRGKDATVAVDVAAERLGEARPVECDVLLSRGDVRLRKTVALSAKGTARLRLSVPGAALWWPNGAGEQALYDLAVTLRSAAGAVDEVRQRIGLRTVRLVREPDAAGESFIIEVNGQPIFCRGTNWIPPDSFPPRFTAEQYRQLLTMAADANMNMLRVWGGGFYEGDTFFSLCDELGLMVWQDFMFACAMYPERPEFLANVRREAEAVVRQVRNRPSLVLWCGNNENQWGFHGGWWGKPPRHYGVGIYDRVLPAVCRRLDPTRPYWPSSPYGGDDPNSEGQGDRHNWEAFHRGQGVAAYLADQGRFLSEFGYQSPPSLRAIRSFTSPADREIQSRVMEHHNKCTGGPEKLVRFIFDDLKLPADFEDYVYKGQVMHARMIQAGVEHWRRNKFHTAGALIWQLNDCWPVSSWSLIDSLLVPKAPYFYARRFFAPVLVSSKRVDGGVEVWIVNDSLERAGGRLDVTLMTFAGKTLYRLTREVSVPANSARTVLTIPDRRLALTDPAACVLVAELSVGKVRASRNTLLFEKPRRIAFPLPKIQAKVVSIDERNLWLSLRADVFVKDLYADFGDLGVELSDNFLDLLPGREEIVAVYSERPMSAAHLRRAMSLRWMT
jgi:beta-mannosidase